MNGSFVHPSILCGCGCVCRLWREVIYFGPPFNFLVFISFLIQSLLKLVSLLLFSWLKTKVDSSSHRYSNLRRLDPLGWPVFRKSFTPHDMTSSSERRRLHWPRRATGILQPSRNVLGTVHRKISLLLGWVQWLLFASTTVRWAFRWWWSSSFVLVLLLWRWWWQQQNDSSSRPLSLAPLCCHSLSLDSFVCCCSNRNGERRRERKRSKLFPSPFL